MDGYGVLVTGGGSGIGLACAQRLARDGAVVTICGRTEARLREAAATIDGDAGWVVAARPVPLPARDAAGCSGSDACAVGSDFGAASDSVSCRGAGAGASAFGLVARLGADFAC